MGILGHGGARVLHVLVTTDLAIDGKCPPKHCNAHTNTQRYNFAHYQPLPNVLPLSTQIAKPKWKTTITIYLDSCWCDSCQVAPLDTLIQLEPHILAATNNAHLALEMPPKHQPPFFLKGLAPTQAPQWATINQYTDRPDIKLIAALAKKLSLSS